MLIQTGLKEIQIIKKIKILFNKEDQEAELLNRSDNNCNWLVIEQISFNQFQESTKIRVQQEKRFPYSGNNKSKERSFIQWIPEESSGQISIQRWYS